MYDYEIRDVDAWEGLGTPIRISLDVSETLGTGPHRPTVSLSAEGIEGVSFSALSIGDGIEDSSTAFVAGLNDANTAISALTIHTTAADNIVAASGVLSLGACDSEEWMAANGGYTITEGRAAWWDWRDGCQKGGSAGQNVTFGFRMGTIPVIESLWPMAAPAVGGMTVEVSFWGVCQARKRR